MANAAIEELVSASSMTPSDYLAVKTSGSTTLQNIKAGNTYFGQVKQIACILRLTSGTPNTIAFIDEGYSGEHQKLNVSSVAMDATKISVTFSETFSQIGAMFINGDDVLTGKRFFGVEVSTTGFDIYVTDNAGTAIDPTTDTTLVSANNAIWCFGLMFPTVS